MAPRGRESAGGEEPGKDNVLRLLGRRGTLPVTVHLLDPLDRAGDRKQLPHAGARGDRRRALGFNVARPLAYRPQANDSQDFQNQKLRLPDERL